MDREERTRPRHWLTALAVVGVMLLALLLYDKWLLNIGFLNPVFWRSYTFVGSYLLCVSLVVIAFARGRPGVLAKAWILTGMVIALAFPLLSPLLYDEHQLYASPASGYEMQWVTQPGTRIGSALKTAQREHESSWCRYTLQGWSDENVLYYGSSCQLGYWRYDPSTEETRWLLSLPERVRDDSTVSSENVSIGQGMSAEHLQGLDPSARYPVRVYSSAASPDGKWLAVAVREYYGPHDVVILRVEG